jgi:signal transduction histidine kinase
MAEPNGRRGTDGSALAEEGLRQRFAAWAEGGRRREFHDVALTAAILFPLAGVPEYLSLGPTAAFFGQLALRAAFALGCLALAAASLSQPIRRLEIATLALAALAIGTWAAGVSLRASEPFACHAIGFVGMVAALALCPVPGAGMLACQAGLLAAFALTAPHAPVRDLVTTALVALLVGGAVTHLRIANHRLQRLGIVQAENQFDAEERTRRAEASKSVFFARMSHELRTPLNAIIGFSEMMEVEVAGPGRPERLTEYARHVAGSGAQLTRLVDTLLDLARIEREVEAIGLERIEPAPLVEGVLRVLGPQIEAEGVRLETDLAAAPASVRASPAALRHAVALLVSDALRHSPRRGTIAVSLSGAGTAEIRLAVEGEGAGGFAIDRGASRELSTLRQIAAAHGGEAAIERIDQRRMRVTLRWPVEGPPGPGPQPAQPSSGRPGARRPET